MPLPDILPRRTRLAWMVLVAVLVAIRLPALVEPAGNDQSLYMYVADRMLEGGAPYLDAWDQKPPGVFFVYAAIRSVWPHAGAVTIADTAAAGLAAWLLIGLGRRAVGGAGGYAAAAIFLLFSHPSLTRLSGAYVRGQCEVFIALAVTAALVAAWRDGPARRHMLVAGLSLGAAFWLKYNALAYVLPVFVAALIASGRDGRWFSRPGHALSLIGWTMAGMLLISAPILIYLAAHDALGALWIATIDYNLRYSAETYQRGALGAVQYLAMLPIGRARADMLWFLGGLGLVVMALPAGREAMRRAGPLGATLAIALSWVVAAVVSIAVNGARDLPQYFVQAGPALAFAAGIGLVLAFRRGLVWQLATAAILVAGLWKVGLDAPAYAGMRLGGLPQLAGNVAFDIRYARGLINRSDYLSRFKGAQKFDAADMDAVAGYVASTTRPGDRILVFGFAPTIYLESDRLSASRFFWSRPVVLEFAADEPGYGSRGLLAELQATNPALVILQKQDWGVDGNSLDFFLGTPHLRAWLEAGYAPDRDTPIFGIWRRTR